MVDGFAELWIAATGPNDSSEPFADATITDGAFTFPDLAPGEYTIEFFSSNSKATAFLGGGAKWLTATTVTVGSSRDTVVTFTFPLKGLIGGTVTLTGPQEPFDTFSVTAISARGGGYSTIGPDGSFLIGGLPIGLYTLEVTSNNDSNSSEYSTQFYYAGASTPGVSTKPTTIPITASSAVRGISIVVNPSAHLSGTVLSQTRGTPVAGASVFLIRTTEKYSTPAVTTTTGADGSYRFATVNAGTYRILIAPKPSGALGQGDGAAWFGGPTVASARVLTVREGVSIDSLDITLPPEAVITGSASTLGPGEPYFTLVSVVPSDFSISPLILVAESVNGTYEVRGLPAGTYRVFGHSYTDAGDYVGWWHPNAASGDEFTVTAGQVFTADLALGPYPER